MASFSGVLLDVQGNPAFVATFLSEVYTIITPPVSTGAAKEEVVDTVVEDEEVIGSPAAPDTGTVSQSIFVVLASLGGILVLLVGAYLVASRRL